MRYELILAIACLATTVFGSLPAIVTLSHGGQLEGKTYTLYNNTEVTVFLGVPYVKSPVGKRRWKKPETLEPWTGIKKATSKANVCIQLVDQSSTGYVGAEDCLYLDITVPGRIDNTTSKPVMVWIHGGSYVSGSGSDYSTTPLSLGGDVIGVSISYRLGALGFLNECPGTGNYGLWDQHYGIKWVNENIAQFGGDPNKVTIFGESAGAGSVSAQAVSSQNSVTLFQRVIQQSGAIRSPWSWVGDSKHNMDVICNIRKDTKCSKSETPWIGDCLSDKSADTIQEMFALNGYWNSPMLDGQFLTASDADRSYSNAKRFDLINGHGSNEGRFVMQTTGMDYSNGLTMDTVKQVIILNCAFGLHTLNPDDCSERVINMFGLSNSSYTDKERVLQLIKALGYFQFNAETMRQAGLMAGSSKSVYTYRLDKGAPASPSEPSYVVEGATHADDLFYVFNGPFLRQNKDVILTEEFGGNSSFALYLMGVDDNYAPLADLMVKMWTNFAKTGNPNSREPTGVANWPQYDNTTRRWFKFDDIVEVFSKTQTEVEDVKSLIALFNEGANTPVQKEVCEAGTNAASKVQGHSSQYLVLIIIVFCTVSIAF